MLAIKVFSLLLLSIIFVEDLLYRAVHWFLFPLLAISLALTACLLPSQTLSSFLMQALFNIAFLILQFVLISLYFSFRQKRWINIFRDLIGWGDILLLLSLCFYCSFIGFVSFYLVSLVIILAGWFCYTQLSKNRNSQIPLAGLQASVFICCLIVSWFHPSFDLARDEWFINALRK